MKLRYVFLFSCVFFLFSCVTNGGSTSSVQKLIKMGRTEEAKSLFTSKADINSADENGDTALHLAAKVNDPDLVTFFIIKGADTELKNFDSKTPLFCAIENDSFEAARALCEGGANIFARNAFDVSAIDDSLPKNNVYYDIMINEKTAQKTDINGDSIVHHFVRMENEEAVSYCLKKKIPLEVKNNDGETPLATALSNSSSPTSIKIAALLLSSGAKEVKGELEYFEKAVLANNYSIKLSDGQTPLHIASIKNHAGVVTFLLENKASVDLQDISGATCLHEAVRYGNVEIAKILLANKANVNGQDSLGKTPLLLIIPKEKQDDMYKLLIANGADINHKDMYGDSVLHIASILNLPVSTLTLFVKAGADINIRNKKGTTPLMSAIEKKNTEQITFYAQCGADIHAEDSERKTPLVRVLHDDVALLVYLINKDNANSTDSQGNTPALVALREDSSFATLQFILDKGCSVNTRNREGNSALYLAVEKNNKKAGELLLSRGADIFAANTKNTSPLRLSLTSNNDSKQWLINSKTISASDGSGNTVLHYAADWQLLSAVNLLLEKGAKVNVTNANGETPLFNAAKSDNPLIIETLIKGGAERDKRDQAGSTAIHAAVRWNALQSVSKLVSLGLDVNAQNANGKTPLAEASVEGNYQMAVLLLSAGANPNIYDASGRTCLTDAIRARQVEIVRLLLSKNANPQIQDVNGRNAYHEAALSNSVEIIKLVSNAGGNPLARDKNGNTPLSLSFGSSTDIINAILGTSKTITDSDGNTPIHIAVQKEANATVLSYLIKKGYSFDTRNSSGFTPLALAIKSNQDDLVSILLENGANPFNEVSDENENALIIALKKDAEPMLGYILKYSGKKTDIMGNTILHYAAHYGSSNTIKRILAFGLDPKVKNIAGETPYDVAIKWKRNSEASLLK